LTAALVLIIEAAAGIKPMTRKFAVTLISLSHPVSARCPPEEIVPALFATRQPYEKALERAGNLSDPLCRSSPANLMVLSFQTRSYTGNQTVKAAARLTTGLAGLVDNHRVFPCHLFIPFYSPRVYVRFMNRLSPRERVGGRCMDTKKIKHMLHQSTATSLS
jgi:hypothetical protein